MPAAESPEAVQAAARRLNRAAMIGLATQRHMEGVSMREIAEEMGIGVSLVGSLIRSGGEQIQRYTRATALLRHKEMINRYNVLLDALIPGIDAGDPSSIKTAADIVDKVGKAFGSQVIGEHLAKQSLSDPEIANEKPDEEGAPPGESLFTTEQVSVMIQAAHKAILARAELRATPADANNPGA